MEFEPINSQEEFEARVAQVYGDVTDLRGQITTLTGQRDNDAKTIADLQKQVKDHQISDLKRSIAQKKGIPMEMANRLNGETEADISADADTVAGVLKAVKGPAPSFEPDYKNTDANTASMTAMLGELRGE